MVSLVINDPTMTPRDDSIHDAEARRRLARLGLRPGIQSDPSWLSDAQKRVVEAAFTEARRQSEQYVQSETPEMPGHWRLAAAGLMPDINDYVKQGYYGLTAIGAPVDIRSHASAMGRPGPACQLASYTRRSLPFRIPVLRAERRPHRRQLSHARNRSHQVISSR